MGQPSDCARQVWVPAFAGKADVGKDGDVLNYRFTR
jgi:hypothetical protein